MKRTVLLAAALVLLLTTAVSAHGPGLLSFVSFKEPNLVTVRITDVTQNSVQGLKVTAATKAGKVSKAASLSEGPPGTYSGKVPTGKEPIHQIVIEAIANEERLLSVLNVGSAEGGKEVVLPMVEQGPQQPGFPWQPVLLGTAAIVLVVGTYIATQRLKSIEEE